MKIIDNNPGRFSNVPMLLVDGGTPWELRLDTSCFADGITGKNQALEFVDLCCELISTIGGAMPLIVENTLVGDDWRTQLNDAAEKPLEKTSLENLAEALKNIPIYVTADDELVSVPADVEAKVFWTLSPDQFQGNFVAVPDLSQARLLVFVRSLGDLQSNLEIFHWNPASAKARGTASRGIVGSAVKFIHELTHAARFRKSSLPNFHWILSDSGWCLSLEDMTHVATPERLVGYRFGAKKESQFPADEGRLWEHSLTGGRAVIESALLLVGVAVRHQDNTGSDSSKEVLLRESLSDEEGLEIMGDPKKLLQIMRARAMRLSAKCPEGYDLQTYVACSRDLIRFQYQCQGSTGW
eukprot:CAMPEP_0172175650 /NCGR_PEP_ID=MMETSP1050-20130122/14351_1 /TAXON_ID=233186 /ORGANISM="Cryptomonas curvata, Strain CCAP979/52" /LENGTH=353 /DNA_ID=CAMNT_0012847787 /DNA_START=126 /DNA_END=1184 /DNA_ORIENTATION=-